MKKIQEAIEKAKFTTRVNSDEAQITIGVDGYFLTKSELLCLLSLVAEKQQNLDQSKGRIIESLRNDDLYIDLDEVPLITDNLIEKP